MSARAAVLRRYAWIGAVVAGVLLFAAPDLGVDEFWTRQITLAAVFGLVVLGLNLSWGYAGELALGHVAVFALAAYCTGIGAKAGLDGVLTLLVSLTAAVLLGVVTAMPGIRLGGWSLAIVSFFLILLIPDVVRLFEGTTGGTAGLFGIPGLTLFGAEVPQGYFYYVVVVALAVSLTIVRNIIRSRHGAAMLVLRQSGVLASSLGISVPRLKITAVAVGALPAGVAGWLYAYLEGFLSPESFGFNLAVTVLAISVVGGSRSIYGAPVAALLIQVTLLRSTLFDQWALAASGLILVVFGVLLSGGLAELARRLLRLVVRQRGRTGPVSGWAAGRAAGTDGEPGAVPDLPRAGLAVTGVGKSFGGNTALAGVTLTAEPGRITALIGANGSGKTTLLNCVSGLSSPDRGEITVGDRRISGLPAARVARAGVGRTFQTPSIPTGLTVAEVVATARYRRPYLPMWAAALRLPPHRRRHREDRAEAATWLGVLGLAQHADAPADSLPLGRRRLLEVARAAAARPSVLLLDEPASGLHEEEIEDLVRALELLRSAGAAVVLVEHNFPLVLRVSQQIHVLELGSLIASGPPAQIQVSERVAESYLGTSAASAGAS